MQQPQHFGRMRPLDEYDISVKTGFLPASPPLRRLPDPYFIPWEEMMDDFNGLLLAGKLREKVLKVGYITTYCIGCNSNAFIYQMPLLDHNKLKSVQEYRRAFLILCMVSHSYVWGKHETTSEVRLLDLFIFFSFFERRPCSTFVNSSFPR